jgi:NarL family two-component system sensor histidine kinase LiaS
MVRRPAATQDVTRPVLPGVVDRAASRSSRITPRRRESLRWRLAVSYVLVTSVAVLALEAVALLVVAQGILYTRHLVHLFVAEDLAPVAATLLEAGAPPGALRAYLERPLSIEDEAPTALTLPRDPRGYTVVTDATGQPWFDNRDPEATDPAELPASDRRLVRRALQANRTTSQLRVARTATATPLTDAQGTPVGVLLQASTLLPAAPGLVTLAGVGLIVGGGAVVGIGTAFGMVASRPLTRRIEALTAAADAWSRGDFARNVGDPHQDELGRLARGLDRMAGNLTELVRARGQLARVRERARLARDLHDTVKQEVFGASLLLGAAMQAGGCERDAIDAAAAAIERAKHDLAELIHELQPLATRPLEDALRELVATHPTGTPPAVRLALEPLPEATPAATEALHRIAREALANAVRHAGAHHVVLRASAEGEAIRLVVEDDGVGFEPERSDGPGLGIASMRERAVGLGGRFRVTSQPGQGTRIVVDVPIDAADEEAPP